MAHDISKVFDPYEIAGIIVPGGTLLFGLAILFPGMSHYVASRDISLGEFGIFTFASYCVGHIIQEPANRLTDFLWSITGKPVENARKERGGLARQQLAQISHQAKKVLNITISIDDDEKEWTPVISQIIAQLANAGVSTRLNIFNRYSALFRGLTFALIVLGILGMIEHAWTYALVAIFLAWCAALRMLRFTRSYARELWVQFLSLSPET